MEAASVNQGTESCTRRSEQWTPFSLCCQLVFAAEWWHTVVVDFAPISFTILFNGRSVSYIHECTYMKTCVMTVATLYGWFICFCDFTSNNIYFSCSLYLTLHPRRYVKLLNPFLQKKRWRNFYEPKYMYTYMYMYYGSNILVVSNNCKRLHSYKC